MGKWWYRHGTSVGRETEDTGTASPVSAPWDISLSFSLCEALEVLSLTAASLEASRIYKRNAALAFLSENCGLLCV